MTTQIQRYDHRGLIYRNTGTKERVLVRQGKRAIMVQTTEVLLYVLVNLVLIDAFFRLLGEWRFCGRAEP